MSTTTRSETTRLARVRTRLDEELSDLELAGLEERAQKVREERDQVVEKLDAAKAARQEAQLAELRQKREAQERHDAMKREQEAKAELRKEAREWFRSAGRFSGGQPLPAADLLARAERAGIDLGALEGITIRVQRRKDGVVCLTRPGQYLRRDYLRVEADHSTAA